MPLINCPECSHEVSSTAKNCPSCGYSLSNKGKLGSSIAPKTTPATLVKPNFLERLSVGIGLTILMLVSGVIFLFIPVIGWFIGGIFLMGAIYAPIQMLLSTDELSELHGSCPYCRAELAINASQSSGKCRECKLQVFVRNDKFCTLTAAEKEEKRDQQDK